MLKCVQNIAVQGHEREIHCRLLNTNHHVQLMSEVLDLQVVGRWKGILRSQCLLHSHVLSQLSTFTIAGDKILGSRDLWSNIKWTLLCSNSFLIFMHITPPWSWSCRVLIGGWELRTKIHHTFPSEFGLGRSFSLLPVSQLLIKTVIRISN